MARRFFSLPIEPVREFYQEPVVRPQIEQIVQVATEAARPLAARGPLATLTPHDEQRGPRPVLPAEHDVRAELLEVESADVVRVRGIAVRLIAAVIVDGTRVRGQLTHVAERPLRDEWLRVHLERHVRAEWIGDTHRQRELLLLEVPEEVVRDVARVRRGAQRLNVVSAARVTRRHRRGDPRRNLEVDLRREAEVARPAAIGPEPVEPEVGHDRFTVVAVDAQPGSEVRVLPHRRAAARARIAVGRPELSDGPAEVERPRVPERGVRVGVERALLRQPRSRPVLPPVEIPLEPLVQLAGVAVEVPGPRAPRNLIGALQVAEIVDIEPRGAALVIRLKQQMIAADLAEPKRLDVSGQ